MKRPKDCYREKGACIEGDSIYVQCRKAGKWRLFQMSGQDKGVFCKVQKSAMALLLKTYTNVKE